MRGKACALEAFGTLRTAAPRRTDVWRRTRVPRRHVHPHLAAADVAPVHRERRLRVVWRCELDKAKAAPPAVVVFDDADVGRLRDVFKRAAQVVLGHGEGQIADEHGAVVCMAQ